MQPDVEVDMRTVRDLDRNLANLALMTGKNIGQVIEKASYLAVRSAAKETPMAKKIRPNTRYRSQAARARDGAPGWAVGGVDIWKRGVMNRKFFRTEHTFQAAKPTPRRKLAKNAWIASVRGIRRTQNLENQTLATRYSRTKLTKDGDVVANAQMTNSLNYVRKIAPNAPRIAIHKTDKQIEGFFLPRVERAMIRQFARGTSLVRAF